MAIRVIGGLIIGAGIDFCIFYFPLHYGLKLNNTAALVIALVAAAIGGIYSAVAFGFEVYGGAPSAFGYVLDISWSLLNTAASLLVWMPACRIVGSFVPPDPNSRRSGTFVFSKNPRGGGYVATTIGTVIGGGWSSHEETHVWQARLFGPAYLPVYGLNWLLNVLFRLFTGKTQDIVQEAYGRVCFEDWAYCAGTTGGSKIEWGWWFLWFFLSLIYVACIALIPIGAAAGIAVVSIVGGAGLLIYSLIRAFTPRTSP